MGVLKATTHHTKRCAAQFEECSLRLLSGVSLSKEELFFFLCEPLQHNMLLGAEHQDEYHKNSMETTMVEILSAVMPQGGIKLNLHT